MNKNVKRGTYMVEFYNGDKYIFGNNYKWWWYHAIELAIPIMRAKGISDHQMFKSVQYSNEKFVDDGGLKYCAADIYQEVIDDVAKATGKSLKPFSEYIFTNSPKDLHKLDTELAKW